MIMVLHELNLAARVADYLVAMKEGVIIALGEASTVLTRPNLDEIFGLKAEVADPSMTVASWLSRIREGHSYLNNSW
nr:ABC transporter ATP-binding protein [Rothia mucilaginosa]